jgi:integrase
MGRPPLPISQHGTIKTTQLEPKLWLARCRYRDADGTTRQVKRTGRSKSAAENELRKALAERRHTAGATLTGESKLSQAAAKWLEQRRAEVDGGDLSPSSLAVYESAWELYVQPALGEVRLREFTVARCEDWKIALRRRKGPSATKSARTVLSGILGYAARLGAIPANPVRDLSRIPGGKKQPVRALTAAERRAWLEAMEADEKAARWDLPDLTRLMLATGCRVGEALALSWDEVDFDAGTVNIRWRLVPVKGESIRRVKGAKSAAGERVLQLPRWCVDMLMRRRVDPMSGYPVFPDSLGGWRYPTNVLRVLRQARDDAGFGWVTSHVFRKTTLTVLDEAGLTPRQVADQAGHSDPSMTQRVYMARKVASEAAAEALEDLL